MLKREGLTGASSDRANMVGSVLSPIDGFHADIRRLEIILKLKKSGDVRLNPQSGARGNLAANGKPLQSHRPAPGQSEAAVQLH